MMSKTRRVDIGKSSNKKREEDMCLMGNSSQSYYTGSATAFPDELGKLLWAITH